MTNLQLVDFCKQAKRLPTVYMWGTYGKVITKSLLNDKAKQYPNRYSQTRQALLKKRIDGVCRGCDCTGLIKWALWTNCDITQTPRYSSKTDRGTAGLYNAAKEKGATAVMPELQGIVLYKTGHVGVYIGNGKVIECTLGARGDGVVETKFSDGRWTNWLKVPEITYIVPETGTPKKKTISITEKANVLNKLGILTRKGDFDK